MFPYADKADEYWTGYYTSRANSKSQARFAQANLHASNKLFAERVLARDATVDETDDLLSAKDAMLDANGINQHHDAITGTARQAVADDYVKRISKAMSESNNEYSRLVSELAADLGVEAEEWKMCTATNTTYLDCPIQDNENSFVIAAHNPAAVAQKVTRAKLPPASSYKVQAYNAHAGVWDDAPTSLICMAYMENTIVPSNTSTCELYIDAMIPA